MSMTREERFTVARALHAIRPGAEYMLDSSGQLTWLDAVQTRPTDAEIQTAVNALLPIIPDISRRQFYQQLATQGLITPAEALATCNGTLPAVIMTKINALTPTNQLLAKMYLGGETTFRRRHPYIDLIGEAYGFTTAQVDAFFLAAALL